MGAGRGQDEGWPHQNVRLTTTPQARLACMQGSSWQHTAAHAPLSRAQQAQQAARSHLLLDVNAVHIHQDVADHLQRLVVVLPLRLERAQEAVSLRRLDATSNLRN